MISNQIIPAFYLLELDGEAIQSVVSDDFNIAKISIASKDFSSDLEAHEALQKSIQFIISNGLENLKIKEKKIDYNPEFYPTSEYKISEEQKDSLKQKQEEADEIYSQLASSNKNVFIITKLFDPIGDFVSIRTTLDGDNFGIEGKVALNPSYYVQTKAFTQMIESMTPYVENEKENILRIH